MKPSSQFLHIHIPDLSLSSSFSHFENSKKIPTPPSEHFPHGFADSASARQPQAWQVHTDSCSSGIGQWPFEGRRAGLNRMKAGRGGWVSLMLQSLIFSCRLRCVLPRMRVAARGETAVPHSNSEKKKKIRNAVGSRACGRGYSRGASDVTATGEQEAKL